MASEISQLEEKPANEDPEEAAEDMKAIEVKREKLNKAEKAIIGLEAFSETLNNKWGDITHRNIGHVHWAPAISVDVNDRSYTKDIATFEVDPVKFKAQFKGNVVDLGAFFLIFLIMTSSN